MNLTRLYTRAVVFPSLIAIISIGILSFYDNKDYKSEWLTGEAVALMSLLAGGAYSIIICIVSLTIFLNKFEKVKSNNTLSGLAWFVLPITWIIICISQTIRHWQYEIRIIEILYLLSLNLPFIVGLVWTFGKYRLRETISK